MAGAIWEEAGDGRLRCAQNPSRRGGRRREAIERLREGGQCGVVGVGLPGFGMRLRHGGVRGVRDEGRDEGRIGERPLRSGWV